MLVEFSVLPVGTGEHMADALAPAIRVIEESGLDYRVHGMGTEIEGDSWDEVMSVVREAHEAVARRAPRVYTVIKIDDFKGRRDAITEKVAHVEQRLGHKVKS